MRFVQMAALVATLVLVCACGEGHGKGHSQDHEEGAYVPATESSGLRLNDGEKWEMDDHTRATFAAMVERVDAQEGGYEPSTRLGRALQGDIDTLIRECTMTGDAHGELHKFLVVFMPAVDALASRGGDAELRAVRKLLDSYPRYFE